MQQFVVKNKRIVESSVILLSKYGVLYLNSYIMSKSERFKLCIDYLKLKHIVRDNMEIAGKMQSTHYNISRFCRHTPSDTFLKRFASAYSIFSETWLLTGEGDMLVEGGTPNLLNLLTENEEEDGQVCDRFRKAVFYLKQAGIISTNGDVANRMEVAPDQVSRAIHNNCTNSFLRKFNSAFGGMFNNLWLYDGVGEMLSPTDASDDTDGLCVAPAPYWCDIPSRGIYLIDIKDGSMTPHINRGDLIAVKEVTEWGECLIFGEMYLITTTNDLHTVRVIKKGDSGSFRLVPLNTSYDEQEISLNNIRKVYKVLGSIKQF